MFSGTTTLAEDLSFGLASENESIAPLERYFGVKLSKTGDYASFDFVGSNGEYYELKSRRDVAHNTFSTAIWELNKVLFSLANPDKKFHLIFRYSDGYFLCEWDTIQDEPFANIKTAKPFYRKNGERPSKVIHIPHTFLTKIEC